MRKSGGIAMAASTYENELFEKLKMIRKGYRAPRQVVQSLYARMMLEYSVYVFTKDRYKKLIDEALDARDEERFQALSNEYSEWRARYQSGCTISEHGYEMECNFEEKTEIDS
ncbi:IDEAL domain-containing protein [Salicibibacter halophilus]|uniref:IDEAL domain-containing protein n=2 Tax=Salicibibacter halophilus TaxID=2502791 RepID=A0A514LGJ9_9BACI|nr:IDEAL domain-containing protein [Salicibibacter halophilus]